MEFTKEEYELIVAMCDQALRGSGLKHAHAIIAMVDKCAAAVKASGTSPKTTAASLCPDCKD